ncbi:MAG: hypothetical protein CR988_03345 [Treponema sp.]|nr:MAG: hypothetical protein CR988_03345 [Treponema sp.]
MKKIFYLSFVALFLCFSACADDPNAINKISIGNKSVGFNHTHSLKSNHPDVKITKVKVKGFDLNISVESHLKGDGEFLFDDELFEKIEQAIKNNTDLPYFYFASHKQIVTIDKHKFIEYISLAPHSNETISLIVQLTTTTPKYKILIQIEVAQMLRKIYTSEAPKYFIAESGKIPRWKNSKLIEEFAQKLVEGKCESKTAQELYNEIQKIIKTIKIH